MATMDKNTRTLVERAEHEGMTYIMPIKWLSVPKFEKLSKQAFGIQFCNRNAEKDPFVFDLTGSPADIRKGIGYLEYLDVTPYFSNYPIMREGRTYNLFCSEGTWTVSRVDKDYLEYCDPYSHITETLFVYDEDDEIVLPEAEQETEFDFFAL